MNRPLRWLLLLSLASTACAQAGSQALGTLRLDAGKHDRHAPLIVLRARLADLVGGKLTAEQLARGALTLTCTTLPQAELPAQWDPAADWAPESDAGALVFRIPSDLAAGQKHTLSLAFSETPAPTQLAIEDQEGKRLLFSCGRKPVLTYNYAPVPHPGGNKVFDRPCYCHPVWSPAGVVVTDDFPKDHPHQRGLFFAWVKVKAGTRHADFWNLGKRTGRTTFEKLSHVAAGPVVASITSHNLLLAQGHPAIRERLILRVWNQPGGPWVLDVLVRHDAIDGPVVLEKNYYGGIAYRGAREWADPAKLAMLTSEGRDRKTGNFATSRWVDTHGTIGGRRVGVVVLDHPSNPRHPQPNRLHPKVPYVGYILPQKAPYTIEVGKPLTLQYRFVVHDGELPQARIEAYARDLAEPASLAWQPN